MGKIVTFGELMLRLQPYYYERFIQCDHVEFTFGGAEANVAVSLANFGLDAAYVTKLPEHAIGQAAVNSLRRYGVDTSGIVRGGERIGIYFNEKGTSKRSSVCIYDRAGSAIAKADPAEFDWDAAFEGTDWFHFTGITPALSENCVQMCLDACKAAKMRGIRISCDLNYRAKLWSKEEARGVLTELCRYVDVCIANEAEIRDIFGIEPECGIEENGGLSREGLISLARQMTEKFGFELTAVTLQEDSSGYDDRWSGMLYQKDGQTAFSRKYDMQIVDRVGIGDAFAAGLIYGLYCGKSLRDTAEFAVAASALKHTVEGDYNMVTAEEVEKLAGGDGSGKIQR